MEGDTVWLAGHHTLRASCDQVKTYRHGGPAPFFQELTLKHVGPIWGQYEASAKVARFMTANNMQGQCSK